MKFLFFTDTHFRMTTPRNRKESNFSDLILGKTKQVFDIAKKENCDFMLFGGDFFHNFESSLQLINILVDFFKKNNDIPIYAVLGNHDMEGYNVGSYSSASLGLIEKLNSFRVMSGVHTINGIKINFQPYKKQLTKADFMVESDIMVAHNYITYDDAVPFTDFSLTCLDEQPKTKIVLLGHFHRPYAIKKFNTHFVCPGAISRLAIGDNYDPSVLLFDGSRLRKIPLTAGKYDDVFTHEKEQERDLISSDVLDRSADSILKIKDLDLNEAFRKIVIDICVDRPDVLKIIEDNMGAK